MKLRQVLRQCIINRTKFGTFHIVEPSFVSNRLEIPTSIKQPHEKGTIKLIKSLQEQRLIRKSCKTARNVLEYAKTLVKVGETTDHIDQAVHNLCIKLGVYPSPLNYNNFPKSICTSVNNVVCHGIPDSRKLADGDLVSIDVTVYENGYHGDCASTILVGNVDEDGKWLVEKAQECLEIGIKSCQNGKPFGVIGRAIESHARKHKLNVVPSVCGHGIGQNFHEPPDIYHFDGAPDSGTMQTGMVFTIEPAITQGDPEVEILEDNWTVVTVDNARSAQFEHTVLITDDGAEILTEL